MDKIAQAKSQGVVLVFSKTKSEAVQIFLELKRRFGNCVDLFHGSNSETLKSTLVAEIFKGEKMVISCTSALGMVRSLAYESS